MFDSILIPLDTSPLAECVLPHALALMRTFQSKATLLHVMDERLRAAPNGTVNALDWQLQQMEAEHYLRALGNRLQASGHDSPNVFTQVMEGAAAESILSTAHHYGHDLIVLGSHGLSGHSLWHLSSVAQKVIARANTSLLIVRVDHDSANGRCTPNDLDQLQYRRVLVPLDGSQRAECVLPVVAQLASQNDTQIVLAQIVARPNLPGRTPPPQELVVLTEQLTERNRIEAEQYLQDIKHRLPGDIEIHLQISEDANASLQNLIAQQAIDLVVMSAHGHNGQVRWPLGSVTTNVVAYSDVSVLIVQDMITPAVVSPQKNQTQMAGTPQPGVGARRDTILVGGR